MTYSAASPVFAKSISAAQFTAFLRVKGSPALVEASAIFAALGSVDPAVALGQFGAESTFGRAGYARITRNWGNIAMATPGTPKLLRAARIASHWTRAFGATGYSPGNGYTYAKFRTWRDSVRAYVALLNTYRLRGWAPSIQAMCRKWLGGVGTGYIGNIVRIANAAAGSASGPAPTPPPPVPPPVPVIPPIPTTPEHVAAAQPQMWGFMDYGFAAELVDKINAWPAWVARSQTMAGFAPVEGKRLPIYVLIHGGPRPLGGRTAMDNLANWLATQGAIAVAIDYPTRAEDGDWAASVAAIRSAIAAVRAKAATWGGDPARVTLVAHSLGGYFGSLAAYAENIPLVLIAADDQIGESYRLGLGDAPLARNLMRGPKNQVTVIAGSADPVSTVAELQAVVDALHATGHPGRWLVIDGADHDSILSDVGTIAAVLNGG